MRVILMTLAFGWGTSAALAEMLPKPAARSSIGVTADKALIAQKAEDAKDIAECERHWDAGTHMTRQVWARTCRRVQERFRKLDLR